MLFSRLLGITPRVTLYTKNSYFTNCSRPFGTSFVRFVPSIMSSTQQQASGGSKKDFSRESLFDLSGKVALVTGMLHLFTLFITADSFRRWIRYRSHGYSSPCCQRSKGLHHGPYKGETRPRDRTIRKEYFRRNHSHRGRYQHQRWRAETLR